MNKYHIKSTFAVLPILLALATACNWGDPGNTEPDISKDTLKFHYATFKQRAADCGDKPDSACTSVRVTYPVFENAPALNEMVLQTVTGRSAINKSADSVLKNRATEFIKEYENDASAKNRKAFYQEVKTVHVVRQDSGLVALQLDAYTYSGGAHGMSITSFVNWNTHANNKITLRDVMQTDVEFKEMLDTIGERIFRKQENLKPNESLANRYFFKDNKFSLNNNFLITPVGLRFVYNVYEIKPYAAGQTTINIPYKDLKSLLKSNSVISQYHF